MPNWDYNKLRITGSKEQIKKVRAKLFKDDEFTFTALIPEDLDDPKYRVVDEGSGVQTQDLRADGTAFNWYDFHLDKWGCKWDASKSAFDETDTEIVVTFTTPWGPPDEWFKVLCKKFKDLNIEMGTLDEGEADYWYNCEHENINDFTDKLYVDAVKDALGKDASKVDLAKVAKKYRSEGYYHLETKDLLDKSTWYYTITDFDLLKKIAAEFPKKKK
jgi:hypothetical protein